MCVNIACFGGALLALNRSAAGEEDEVAAFCCSPSPARENHSGTDTWIGDCSVSQMHSKNNNNRNLPSFRKLRCPSKVVPEDFLSWAGRGGGRGKCLPFGATTTAAQGKKMLMVLGML